MPNAIWCDSTCTYTAGVDNREETLRQLEAIFPRWYDRKITESGTLGPTLVIGEAARTKSFEDTVRDYLHAGTDEPYRGRCATRCWRGPRR